ncbi:activating signal cointegrator 1 isoform X2 [Aplysia californica]|nr:activating signal cointegrator 1 isoform X2 [Aplysia californica]
MRELLDASHPKVRVFLQELRSRCKVNGGHDSVQAYKKDFGELPQTAKSKKKKGKESSGLNDQSQPRGQNNSVGINEISEQRAATFQQSTLSGQGNSAEIGIGAKKKSKYVPLYSKEGQAKSVIQIPGRHTCECQAAKHKLINNCMKCGRVVCEQEGAGPCVFCGNLVCTPEDQEIVSRGSKKGEKLRQYLMKGTNLGQSGENADHVPLPHALAKSQQGFDRAMKHRDKLLEYDKNSVRRTQVIDDECDYYATDANRWLSNDDREKLRKREEELRHARHGSRRDRKITFDFAGRRVVDAEEDAGKSMYNNEDAVIQQVHYGKSAANGKAQEIINPTIVSEPPIFIEDPSSRGGDSIKSSSGFSHKIQSKSSRIQDRELQEMSDEGMCMSMHQPWASLLVCGIKMHEGRTWYTPHRGRLWIAATAKTPPTEEIAEMEQMYRALYGDVGLPFPSEYPAGCLLGCVNVDDCLDQDEYRKQFPDGESGSPYVFICTSPQQLIVKFPIKGKHKIYKLETHIHQAAKKGLR